MLRYIVYSIALLLASQSSVVAKPTITPPHAKTPMSLAEKNFIQGMTFLEENKRNPEIHTLASGLQYKIIKEGTGGSPGPTDFVTVNYRGTLIDGTEFDSSYTHNTPTTFAVNAVIPGWSEALQLMKPGDKWTLYIPPKLAYGSQGAGRLIGPNTTLIFDIEFISTKPVLDEQQDGFHDAIEDED
jgi:FKBP-type peptidyl-prolyl cis-trans isomerase